MVDGKNKELVKTRMFKATGEEITIIPDSNPVSWDKPCLVWFAMINGLTTEIQKVVEPRKFVYRGSATM